jgi:hypothetical protein
MSLRTFSRSSNTNSSCPAALLMAQLRMYPAQLLPGEIGTFMHR